MAKETAEVAPPKRHANIYAALSAFQGELKPMAKSGKVEFQTKSGGTLSFTYTPLGEIMSTIYPLLAKNGLSVRHEIGEKGVEAILTHETYKSPSMSSVIGEFDAIQETSTQKQILLRAENEIRSGLVKVGQAQEMKDVGAAITYARRYTLTMVLGISSEDDKDAELLEQSAKNAVQTVYDRFKAAFEKEKTVAGAEKSIGVLQKDLKTIEGGKAPALGLSKEQYVELIQIGEARIEAIKVNQDPKGE